VEFRVNILPTKLHGVVVAETAPIVDHRGSFTRFFCERELSDVICDRRIVQINYSCTARAGAVRGLHLQRPPYAEMKLVRCLKGRVLDVAVDLRTGSQSCLQWYAEELSPENGRMLIIPEGCAHGFQALEPHSELLYLHTSPYVPAAEIGVRFDDARLSVPWPLPVVDLSPRDRLLPTLDPEFCGFPA
jgi:dTDP-4-dehydrorhamnose 3,5-epimerase